MIDLTGQRFSRYLVLEEAGRNKWGTVMWKCLCDCGTIKIICGNDLRNGGTKSCGCLQKEKISETRKINLEGQRFSRYIILEEAGRDKKGNILWKCLCDCGTIKIVRSDSLRSGASKSCGCLRDERMSKIGKSGRGETHPRYNPNITDEERQIGREYPEYYEWRKAVYKRDDYICQYCGKLGVKLHAHHLESYRDNPELRTLLENGITLCEECHKNFHHQFGYGNTRDQFEEFLRTQKNLKRNRENIRW